MKAFWAIVKLTFKSSIRSHIFQLLLGVLILCVVFIPSTVSGDGTANGFIKISLLYSLGTVAFVLSLSSIWLGCFVLNRDMETYQLHLVTTKPVSRITIWLGKWFGVNLVNLLLLLLGSLAIYFTILYQFSHRSFSEKERAKIKNEVLVGRRVFMPKLPNFADLARRALPERINKVKASGGEIDKPKLLAELQKETLLKYCEIPYLKGRDWFYENLPLDKDNRLFVRYRFFVNKISRSKQRVSTGTWTVAVPIVRDESPALQAKRAKAKVWQEFHPVKLTANPKQFMTGTFHEFSVPGTLVAPNGNLRIAFSNYDQLKNPIYLQPSDGPKVLLRVASFAENYFRGIVVIALQLMILSGIACAAASFLSMPTAVFLIMSYLAFGSLSSYLTAADIAGEVMDTGGYWLGKTLLLLIIPMQKFEVTRFLSNGELIEYALMGKLFLSYFCLRALPFIVFGMWLYRRRQLGLIVRK